MTVQTVNEVDLPAQVNLTICAGDTMVKSRTIKEAGVAVDISDDAITVTISNNRGTALHTLTIGSGVAFGATGEYIYTLTAVQTAALPTNCELNLKVKWVKASGVVKHLEKGTIKVTTP